MSARGSGEKPSIVVLHSINFEESWTKQTYLDIERKFGEEGFTVKAIPYRSRYPHDGRVSREENNDPRESSRATHLSRMHRRSSWLVARPLFDKEWKDIPLSSATPEIICTRKKST